MFMDAVEETNNIMLNVDNHWCGHMGEGMGLLSIFIFF
jgi:hypothetical protein